MPFDNSQLTPPVSEHDHMQGSPDAPITLVQFGDYQCPACGQAYPVIKDVQRRLGDQLCFVFRNFPLPQHQYAEHAAEVAEAAGSVGGPKAFWAMHDTLYEHQDALDDAHLARYVEDIGLNLDHVNEQLQNGAPRRRVRDDLQSGEQSGVRGTPTFFINGHEFQGNWADPDAFAEALTGATAGR